jgi:hypothetical protein
MKRENNLNLEAASIFALTKIRPQIGAQTC